MAMPKAEQPEHLWTVGEIAERLGVTDETVRRWLREKALAGVRLGKKAGWRVRESDLERFIRDRMNVNGGNGGSTK